MKQKLFLGLALVSAIAFVSCKSTESSYKKAYEKAQAAEQQEQQVAQEIQVIEQQPAQVVVAPVAPVEENVSVRQEKLNALNGTLKAYNVVCGSFRSLDNANRLCSTLKSAGYPAQVAQNPETGMYRVVANSFDDKSSAVNTRNLLRGLYPDAWLLLRQ
ncbi:MAG: SPOR domain-containing protein [Bacteroidaceae bacterium]|nr:SPOR domain-containing protein [Bacteroidaceae bacterium]